MEGQSKRTMDVDPTSLFTTTAEPDDLQNNPFKVLSLETEMDQSVQLTPEALPFVPLSSPALPETASATPALKKSINNNEFKKLKSAEKKLYDKQGEGPAHSATYQLKES